MRFSFAFASVIFLGWAQFGAEFATAAQIEPGPPVLTEVISEDSPDFPLGKPTLPNLTIRSQENPDMGVSLGIRFQGTAQLNAPEGQPSTTDFYSRRVRFEISADFSKNSSFVMDVRNDNSNRGDTGERTFNVGDAYFVQKKLGGSSLLNLKGYRAKVDVSRSQTAKSSWQIYYDRAFVTDEAAQYVNHNRRATNVQLFGDHRKKISYSLVLGDGVHSSTFNDAKGESAESIVRQNPMFGGKVLFSPIDGWEETQRTETYFGQGRHASVGAGVFHTGNIRFLADGNEGVANRTLVNIEASTHYKSFFVQFEYFRFLDTIRDFSEAPFRHGSANGWYLTSEYVMPQLAFVAPFVRIERWNRFEEADGFVQISRVAGINWYLRGNTIRIGVAGQSDSFGAELDRTNEMTYRFLSQLHF